MKTTLSLEILQMKPVVVVNPFWFTVDGSLHLGGDKKSMEVDLSTVGNQNIYEIVRGLKKKLIKSDIPVEEIEKLLAPQEVSQPNVERPVETKQIEKRLDIKKKKVNKETAELLSKGAQKVKEAVGSDVIEDGIISPGMNDINMLNSMVEYEVANANRKGVLSILNARIDAVKKVGIDINPEVFEIEEVEDKKLKYDPNTQTLNEVKDQENN